MSATKRVTVYLDPKLHQRVRRQATKLDQSVSCLVNEALRRALAEDAADLAAFKERANEPNLPFQDFVQDWKRRGKL
jgi:predicted transcriptional regulator